jgi:hypothetical protein
VNAWPYNNGGFLKGLLDPGEDQLTAAKRKRTSSVDSDAAAQ